MTPKTAISSRMGKLIENLTAHEAEALVLNPGPSLTYITGLHFHLSERPVVVLFCPGSPVTFILPELETAKLSELAYEYQAFPYGEVPSSWPEVFQQAIKSLRLEDCKIGVEPRSLRVLELKLLEAAAPKANFIVADDLIASLRMKKDEQEISAMQEAARIAQEALIATLPDIKIGQTEEKIATQLSLQLLRCGSNPQLPFFPIVSSGPNSANPHAFPSKRKLAEGDLLVIDWGANVDGYYSDITRTFALDSVSPEFHKIAEIVYKANQAGHATAGPGISAGEIDRAARTVIENSGYGEYFIHRTGHGLGLEGHEEPFIRGDNEMILEPGMTFTIEPGIYLPGRGGVRIEDDVVITQNGIKSLTDLPRNLITLG